MWLSALLLLLTAASWMYWLIALVLVRAHFGRKDEPEGPPDFTPPVSILKPVKGVDFEAFANFASFCQQDYPEYEILFGVADPADPVVSIIRTIQTTYEEQPIRLILAPEVIGTNRKASLLHHLAAAARHDILVISDSDMRVTPDYLRRVVAPLADATVGLVTCPYKAADPRTFTAKLEALHMGFSFLPSILVGRLVLGMRFAMGASNSLRREVLARIGGFAGLADYLADDYQLGARIAATGLRVHLSRYLMVTPLGATRLREQWEREIRWMQCNRVSRPAEYPGLWLTYTLPLALLYLIASDFARLGWAVMAGSLAVRWSVAWFIMTATDQQALRRWLVWLPVRDCLSAVIWVAGLWGRRITWRGESFRLVGDGRLEPLAHPATTPGWRHLPARMVRGLIRRFDALLRRLMGIYEFSDRPDCLFRLRRSRSPYAWELADGTRVNQGDAIGELHFWNEHIPPMPPGGPDLAWARAFRRRLMTSLRLLAEHVHHDPRWTGVEVFGGTWLAAGQYEPEMLTPLAARLGVEIRPLETGRGLWPRFVRFWEDGFTRTLIWTYNPASLRGRRGDRRYYILLSRRNLLQRYGSAAPHPEAGPTAP